MRAQEFVVEARRSKLTHSFRHASPGAVTSGNQDHSYDSRMYDTYRIAALSGMDPEDLEKVDVHSWISNMPLYTHYTQAEYDKVARVMKKMGHTVKHHAPPGSRESPDTHTVSPVVQFQGY